MGPAPRFFRGAQGAQIDPKGIQRGVAGRFRRASGDRPRSQTGGRARSFRRGKVPPAARRLADAARRFRRHGQPAVPGKAPSRRPSGILRHPMDAAPPSASGEIGRRQDVRHRIGLRPERRSAAGDQGSGRGRQAQRSHAGSARRHRLGKNLHDGEGNRGNAAPRPHPRAQQDACCPALWGVQVVLPRQCGRVFRLLL